MAEFDERVWNDIIKVMVQEPFCWYINTLRYAKDHYWKTEDCDAFYLSDDKLEVFDKFDWRKCWADFEYNPSADNVWVVDYLGLKESIADEKAKKCKNCNDKCGDADCGWEWSVIQTFSKVWKNKRKTIRRVKKTVGSEDVPQEFLDDFQKKIDMARGK